MQSVMIWSQNMHHTQYMKIWDICTECTVIFYSVCNHWSQIFPCAPPSQSLLCCHHQLEALHLLAQFPLQESHWPWEKYWPGDENCITTHQGSAQHQSLLILIGPTWHHCPLKLSSQSLLCLMSCTVHHLLAGHHHTWTLDEWPVAQQELYWEMFLSQCRQAQHVDHKFLSCNTTTVWHLHITLNTNTMISSSGCWGYCMKECHSSKSCPLHLHKSCTQCPNHCRLSCRNAQACILSSLGGTPHHGANMWKNLAYSVITSDMGNSQRPSGCNCAAGSTNAHPLGILQSVDMQFIWWHQW